MKNKRFLPISSILNVWEKCYATKFSNHIYNILQWSRKFRISKIFFFVFHLLFVSYFSLKKIRFLFLCFVFLSYSSKSMNNWDIYGIYISDIWTIKISWAFFYFSNATHTHILWKILTFTFCFVGEMKIFICVKWTQLFDIQLFVFFFFQNWKHFTWFQIAFFLLFVLFDSIHFKYVTGHPQTVIFFTIWISFYNIFSPKSELDYLYFPQNFIWKIRVCIAQHKHSIYVLNEFIIVYPENRRMRKRYREHRYIRSDKHSFENGSLNTEISVLNIYLSIYLTTHCVKLNPGHSKSIGIGKVKKLYFRYGFKAFTMWILKIGTIIQY